MKQVASILEERKYTVGYLCSSMESNKDYDLLAPGGDRNLFAFADHVNTLRNKSLIPT